MQAEEDLMRTHKQSGKETDVFFGDLTYLHLTKAQTKNHCSKVSTSRYLEGSGNKRWSREVIPVSTS